MTDHDHSGTAEEGVRSDAHPDLGGYAPEASNDARGSDDASDMSFASMEAEIDSEIAVLTVQRDELRAVAQHLQADFENYKKRAQREQAAVVARANERLLEDILPALDSFELAVASLDDAEHVDIDKLTKGVVLAVGQLRDAVERAGLVRMTAEGAPFDPEDHEAVLHDDGDGEPIVAQVLRNGYKLNGRVLRPAMVKVSRAG